MAIDMENETVLSLTEATKVLPRVGGKRPSISTLWRWCRKGLHGQRLEYIRIGRNIATSKEALARFFSALADADKPLGQTDAATLTKSRPSDTQRQTALREADKVLQRAGI